MGGIEIEFHLASRMGYQTTLLARNKLDPNVGHNVYTLTVHYVWPITPKPNRVHRVNL
jgi:hypothetical protein